MSWNVENKVIIGGSRKDLESLELYLDNIDGLSNTYYANDGTDIRSRVILIKSSLGKMVVIFKGCIQFLEINEEIERIRAGYPKDADRYTRSKYITENTNRIEDVANTMAKPYYTGTEIREAIEKAEKLAYKNGYN